MKTYKVTTSWELHDEQSEQWDDNNKYQLLTGLFGQTMLNFKTSLCGVFEACLMLLHVMSDYTDFWWWLTFARCTLVFLLLHFLLHSGRILSTAKLFQRNTQEKTDTEWITLWNMRVMWRFLPVVTSMYVTLTVGPRVKETLPLFSRFSKFSTASMSVTFTSTSTSYSTSVSNTVAKIKSDSPFFMNKWWEDLPQTLKAWIPSHL